MACTTLLCVPSRVDSLEVHSTHLDRKRSPVKPLGVGAAARGCGGRDSGGVGMGDRLYRSHAYRQARSAISHIGLSLPSESRDHTGKEGNSRQVSSASDASQTELGLTGIYPSSGTLRAPPYDFE